MSGLSVDLSGQGFAQVVGEDPIGTSELFWESFPAAIYVCDRDGHIVRYNESAAELWGRRPALGDPAERFCGSHRLYRLDGGPLPHRFCPMADALQTGLAARNQEVVIERPDGSRIVALVNIQPLKDAAGHVTGAINCFHDITEQKRTERNLRRSREELEDYFENAVVGMHLVGGDGIIHRVNRAQLELLGYSRDEYVGRHVSGIHADGDLCKDIFKRLAAGEKIDKLPVKLLAKDGAIRHVLLSSSPRFRDGKFISARAVILDVTAQHDAENQRRENERRLRDMFDALPAAVYTTDAAGRITFYNEAAAQLWGCRPEFGKSEWCGSWKLYWPDGTPLPHDECPMALCLKQQRPIRGMEAIAERPDGVRVPFIPYPTPFFDESGKLAGAINLLFDLTERKEAEQKLQQQTLRRLDAEHAARRLAAIVESSEDAILSKDTNGVIQSWNKGAERLYGYTAEEVIGKPVTILIPAERQDEEPNILARIRRGERVEPYETVRRRKDGSLVDISLSVSPVRDAEGRIVGASKIARDITERRRAEEQQRLLLREMNHRVKNLMTLAASLVGLSARSAKTPKDLANSVCERLAALARAHDLTLPKPCEPLSTEKSTTLHALIQTIASPYDLNGARISIRGCNTPVGPRAATNIALLLHEFATNAAKYGALSVPAGRVDIECSEDGDQAVIVWSEQDGPAIAPGIQDGFGTILSRITVQDALAGDIVRDWRPEGLHIRLSMTKDRLTS